MLVQGYEIVSFLKKLPMQPSLVFVSEQQNEMFCHPRTLFTAFCYYTRQKRRTRTNPSALAFSVLEILLVPSCYGNRVKLSVWRNWAKGRSYVSFQSLFTLVLKSAIRRVFNDKDTIYIYLLQRQQDKVSIEVR